MRWRKLGRIYAPDTGRWWMASGYAHLPTPVLLNDRVIRVYFSALDAGKYGRIASVDLDADDPCRILAESSEPILDLGTPGSFDDSGVTPCWIADNRRQALPVLQRLATL